MTLAELRARTTNPATGKNWTGEEVARACEVSTNTYFRWEWGTSIPGGVNLTKLEKVLPGSTHTLVKVLSPAQEATPTPTPSAPAPAPTQEVPA